MTCQCCGKEFEPVDYKEETETYLKWRANLYGFCSWLCESRSDPKDNELIEMSKAIDDLDLSYAKHVRKLNRR